MKRKILLILPVLLLAVALWLSLPAIQAAFPGKKQNPPIPENPVRTLHLSEPSGLSSIEVEPGSGEGFTLLIGEDGSHTLAGEEETIVNASAASLLVKAVTEITVQQTVTDDAAEVESTLEDMGLSPARSTSLVTFRDGHTERLETGVTVPGTGYSYFRWSGAPGIYMCDEGISDALHLTKNRMRAVTQPEITAGLVDEVTVVRNGETLRVSLFRDAAGEIAGNVTEPVSYPMEAEEARALATACAALRLGTREADPGAADGWTDPLCTVRIHARAGRAADVDQEGALTVVDREEATLEMIVGCRSGDYFYRCGYADDVYLVSGMLLDRFLKMSPESLYSGHPLRISENPSLCSVEIETAEGITALHLIENSDGETQVLCDGETVPMERYETLLSALNGLSAADPVSEKDRPSADVASRWRVTLTETDGRARRVEGRRLDLFTDAVFVNDVCLYAADGEAADMALAAANP